jgi:hypothetical protein
MYNKFLLNYNDFISGDKFKNRFKKSGIYYHFSQLNQVKSDIILTHNEKEVIDDLTIVELEHDFKLWFAQNVISSDERVIQLPIGLLNHFDAEQQIRNKTLYQKSLINKRFTTNRLLLSCDVQTNHKERISAYTYFWNKDFCTTKRHIESGDYSQFCDDILSHNFVVCPYGISEDTHLVWETLYLKRIPIVKRSQHLQKLYEGLPIVFVDDWSEINHDFLEQKILEIQSSSFNLEKLKIGYWFNLIEGQIKSIKTREI